MNFAIIKLFGKQHLVREGDLVTVNAKIDGQHLEIPEVLLLNVDDDLKIGTPLVFGASVFAEIVKTGKGEKLHISKFKSKVRYRRAMGFRPLETVIKITSLFGKVAKKPVAEKKAPIKKVAAKKAPVAKKQRAKK